MVWLFIASHHLYLSGQQVGGRRRRTEGCRRLQLDRRRVQILVVVANIQMETLKTEVEKGSV